MSISSGGPDSQTFSTDKRVSLVGRFSSLITGTAIGLSLGAVLGLIWYAADVFLNSRFLILIFIFGLAVGMPIGVKSRAPQLLNAVVAFLATAFCLAIVFYFVDRHAFVEALTGEEIPLWSGWDNARLFLKTGFKYDKLRYVMLPVTLLCGALGGWKGDRPGPAANT